MNREHAYARTVDGIERCVRSILESIEIQIEYKAKKGATHIVGTFDLNDDVGVSAINDWSTANEVGKEIVKELEELRFDADYIVVQGAENTQIKIQVYWGEDTEGDYVPLDAEWK